jgi:hypothetical protein
MNLKDLLTVSGEHGLFRFIAQGRNAIIVEHLETGKRSSAHSSAKVSSLVDISIFTVNEDMPLGKVLDKIFEKENGGPAIDAKSPSEKLKNYFEELVPDYDKNRVYPSDIKKVFLWYNTLQKLNLLVKDDPEKSEKSEKSVKSEKSEKKPVKSEKKTVPEQKPEQPQKAKQTSKTKTKADSKSGTKTSSTKTKTNPKSK